MTALPLPDAESHAPASQKWLRRYVFSTDHKVIGIQFLMSGLLFFLLGGMLAMLMRWDLAWPNNAKFPVPILGKLLGWDSGIMPAEFYNMIMTLHATVMIFFVVIPLQVSGFGNYLIPLKIGARDMAFPFLNGLSFWIYLAAGMLLLTGAVLAGGAAATGWTAYPPLSAISYNGGGSASANWPLIAILVNFVFQFLMFGFIGVHLFRSLIPATILSAMAAAVSVLGLQRIAFDGQSCWFASLILLGFSSIMGAINYLCTILKMRCKGMRMLYLPLTVWNLFITSIMVLLATPVLACVLVMNLMDHHHLTSFFEPANWVLSDAIQSNAGGGYALLDQHLFWFYSHPAVYIMILPVMGIISDILPVFSRKPLFGYRPMVYASSLIAGLGFLVWGHHMFQNGMNPSMGAMFAMSTMLIAVPSGIKTFNWLATMYGGAIRLTVPMLNAIFFISLFVIGGLSGIVMASSPIDAHLHNTYYIVAHIHYVLFGGSTFGIFAGIYYWYPKMFGRMLQPKLGYIHTIWSYITFNLVFFPMHILGLQGMPRRLADPYHYTMWAHLQPMNVVMTLSAFGLLAAQLPFICNFFGSMFFGEKAPANPWQATTLEWTTSSPPPVENFSELPVVKRGPYEYSLPGHSTDWVPQDQN